MINTSYIRQLKIVKIGVHKRDKVYFLRLGMLMRTKCII